MGEALNGILGTKIGLPKLARRCPERHLLNRRRQPSSVFSGGYHGTPLEISICDPGPSVQTWNDQVMSWNSSLQHGGTGPPGGVSAV